MERRSHDSISRIESFFDTITMMNIHIYVEDSRVYAVGISCCLERGPPSLP